MKNNVLQGTKKVHFVGIGGIGMSGIARVLLEMGHSVSGSDVETSNLTKKLESIGARVFVGHAAANVLHDTDMLVYSSSVSKNNPELLEAKKRGIRINHRAEVLGGIFNAGKGIAVTGTHGKTTTTSMISVMLEKSGMDPTVIIGGEVDDFDGNSKLGKGDYIVAEADESDSSFLHLEPLYAVVTNIETEHMDHFKDLDDIIRSYRAFINNVKTDGMVIYNREDPNCCRMIARYKDRALSFGFSESADIYPIDIKSGRFRASFKCVYKKKILGGIELALAGRHNILNALAAILVGINTGLKFSEIARSIKKFTGAKRRFQLRAAAGGVTLIDDYAHHPTEIKAVLEACRSWKGKRLIAVFQPHRYSRTKFLADQFGQSFNAADILILTDIYAASEKPIKGVSVKNIYERVRSNGMTNVVILKKDEIAAHLMQLKKRQDMIVVMGAGDIKKVADQICLMLEREKNSPKHVPAELKKLLKGKVLTKESLRSHTSFKIGGPVSLWVEPSDYRDLRKALSFAAKNRLPVFVIGNGTNVLARDEGFEGMVLRLGAESFKYLAIKEAAVRVGSGFSLPALVRLCCEKGLRGLESLVGIPGTVGGAIYMNAGGWSSPMYKNIGDIVTSLKVMDYKGNIRNLRKGDMTFGYRRSNLDWCVILEASLKLEKADRDELVSSCTRFLKIKKEKQVLDMPSAGCVFKNPENFQFTCGQMIDMLGLKGRRVGGAEISAKHANFIVNRGRAVSGDVLSLIEFIKKRVKDNYDVALELEIKVI